VLNELPSFLFGLGLTRIYRDPNSSPFCKRKLEGLAAVHKQKLVHFSELKTLLFARRLLSRATTISQGSA
jgi:hypothetical protein